MCSHISGHFLPFPRDGDVRWSERTNETLWAVKLFSSLSFFSSFFFLLLAFIHLCTYSSPSFFSFLRRFARSATNKKFFYFFFISRDFVSSPAKRENERHSEKNKYDCWLAIIAVTWIHFLPSFARQTNFFSARGIKTQDHFLRLHFSVHAKTSFSQKIFDRDSHYFLDLGMIWEEEGFILCRGRSTTN